MGMSSSENVESHDVSVQSSSTTDVIKVGGHDHAGIASGALVDYPSTITVMGSSQISPDIHLAATGLNPHAGDLVDVGT